MTVPTLMFKIATITNATTYVSSLLRRDHASGVGSSSNISWGSLARRALGLVTEAGERGKCVLKDCPYFSTRLSRAVGCRRR